MEDIQNLYTRISLENLTFIRGGTLGGIMKYYRQNSGIPAKELASRLHVSVASLSHYENDRRRPELEFIRDFSNALEIDIKTIFSNL